MNASALRQVTVWGLALVALLLGISLLSSCSQDMEHAYRDGWNTGALVVDQQLPDAKAYKVCDRAMADKYGTDPQNSASPETPEQRAFWNGCMNGTSGSWEQLPPSELDSLAESD